MAQSSLSQARQGDLDNRLCELWDTILHEVKGQACHELGITALGEFPVGLLEEEGILLQIWVALADDYPLCLAFLQGFE